MISVGGLPNVFQDLSLVALFHQSIGSPQLGHRHLASPSIACTLWHARSRAPPALPAEFSKVRNIMLSETRVQQMKHGATWSPKKPWQSTFVWCEFRTPTLADLSCPETHKHEVGGFQESTPRPRQGCLDKVPACLNDSSRSRQTTCSRLQLESAYERPSMTCWPFSKSPQSTFHALSK